ncbi:ABC transporter permease subunit [Zavarzinia compransoris]|uniref:Taurine ABC transporter permease n=1 Tax=Zavarzinia compransoris TaxID=1264899 RepID=A0A317DSZ0_9PROT|nr:ABC transporter permease subunit [Zavarzinia compransoris]PWR17791.1 taurine ABC transporter permease [Zavarzinia compransoris]TDP49321.1 taurine transport system permease protein [Zavarzinia compransoris]
MSTGSKAEYFRWLPLATVAALVGLWWLAAVLKVVSPVFLPSPLAVARRLYGIATEGYVDGTLLQHGLASLGRVAAALAASIAVAVPAGFAIGLSRVGRGVLDPIIELLRPIPPLAYLPLIVIWLGIGEVSKVTVIALAMIPPIALSAAAGVRGVAADRVEAALALGASRAQVIGLVVLPSSLPGILTGIRIGLGAGWTTLVAAELVAATRGLGFMIKSGADFLVTDVVIGGILVIAGIALLMELAMRRLEARLTPWAKTFG